MEITKETVLHVAELGRLEFNQEELEKFTEQLGRILQYVEKLNELDTRDVEPTFHVLDVSTPLREDIVESWLTQDEALENAPHREEGFFAVPKFIED